VRVRVILAVFAALAVLAGVGIYVAVRSLSNGLPLHLATQQCVVDAHGSTGAGSDNPGKVTLQPPQMANAATIAAVGIRRGLPSQAVVVALATALQESKLENLTGGDRDSVGLFQQRPSQNWGTPQQIADPRYAAGAFYDALLRVRGWSGMPVEDAAQAVQRSADGRAYQRWVDEAQVLTTALTGAAGNAVACTITSQPAQRGPAAASALAQSLAIDWGQVDAVADTRLLGVELAVDGARTGWQYAHWLVAHSADQNVKSVRFGDEVWTAKAGTWSRSSGDRTVAAGDRVVAEVYAES
jgi:hypothetical protein